MSMIFDTPFVLISVISKAFFEECVTRFFFIVSRVLVGRIDSLVEKEWLQDEVNL